MLTVNYLNNSSLAADRMALWRTRHCISARLKMVVPRIWPSFRPAWSKGHQNWVGVRFPDATSRMRFDDTYIVFGVVVSSFSFIRSDELTRTRTLGLRLSELVSASSPLSSADA